MVLIDLTTKVEKETLEVSQFAAKLLIALKQKKPIEAIAVEELPALAKAVEGIDQLPSEFKESLSGASKAVLIPIIDAMDVVLGKQPSAA